MGNPPTADRKKYLFFSYMNQLLAGINENTVMILILMVLSLIGPVISHPKLTG